MPTIEKKELVKNRITDERGDIDRLLRRRRRWRKRSIEEIMITSVPEVEKTPSIDRGRVRVK